MSPRSRVARTKRMRLAALTAAGALALTGCDFDIYSLPLPGGADLGDDPYSVQVKFRDVLDLVPQSSVKVNDVSVGMVDEIELDGYTADVTVLLRDDVELPDNAIASIRQTSLLGEKFVSLSAPEEGASPELLEEGDVIPLERSGRNPEVEEVLGALSLLLNGGGVAQLKTIASELNAALEGREGSVKSVLGQLDTFMGQLDDNKADIVTAIESLNRLAVSLNRQRGTIELALDELPQAVASIDRQRDDLVRMLEALNELSSVGVDVIKASKTATIDSLRQLDPILTKLAEAGDAFPKSLQVFLTYPFVDEVVGRNPVQARNLHMGDYTNLSVQLDLDLRNGLPTIPGLPGLPPIDLIEECSKTPLKPICDTLENPPDLPLPDLPVPTLGLPGFGGPPLTGDGGLLGGLTGDGPRNGTRDGQQKPGDDTTGADPGAGGCLLPPLVCRPAPGAQQREAVATAEARAANSTIEELGYNSTLGALLIQGLVQR